MDRTRSYRTDVPTPRMLTTAVAAKEIGISSGTVRKLLELEELRRVDLGRHAVRVTRSSLDGFVARGGSTV
ncbi:MAG: DNA-binding protein [Planctomycetes bacterium]|nr:DNA-binding protein [Planctomycetota bacterium]